MVNEQITKTEVKKIINDELNKLIKNELSKELISLIKNGKGRDEVNNLIKDALNAVYKFMWTKRNTWNGDIK